jgi:hypothetical protein
VQELRPGQVLSGIRFALTPGGVISGRLTDDRGEVVVGAIVQVLRTTHKSGLRERTLVQSVVSNDLGEYRFFMLKPGQYYISLMPQTFQTQVPNNAFSIPMFYPGTIDAKAAKPFDLHVGELIENLNFAAIPTRSVRISGDVQGNGSDGVDLVLSPVNGTATKRASIRSDSTNPTFQFTDILPGPYTLVAHTYNTRTALPLDVRNVDLLGTRVFLGTGFKIPARVRIEGHAPGDDPELEKISFSIRPDIPVPELNPDIYSPFADGRFIIEVLRRDYWIDLARTEDYYLKSITLEGTDVLNQGLHVTSSVEVPMEIVVDKRFGEVQGAAVAGNVTVVLVPDAVRRNQRPLYRSTKTPNGAFRFQKVPPGDYKVFVWSEDTIDNGGPWLDPDYLLKYEDRATPVRIQADVKTVIDRPLPVF